MLYLVALACIPPFLNIGGLLFITFYIFAYLGVQLFGTMQYGKSINDHANFRTWPDAMVTLLRTATADNW